LRRRGIVLSQRREHGREESKRYRGEKKVCSGTAMRTKEKSRWEHIASNRPNDDKEFYQGREGCFWLPLVYSEPSVTGETYRHGAEGGSPAAWGH